MRRLLAVALLLVVAGPTAAVANELIDRGEVRNDDTAEPPPDRTLTDNGATFTLAHRAN